MDYLLDAPQAQQDQQSVQQLNAGRALRDSQLALFETKHAEFLDACRTLAVEVCKRRGVVSINDIRSRLTVPPGVHPSVLGSVFKTRNFSVVGFTEAAHPQAHARIVRVYALKGGK